MRKQPKYWRRCETTTSNEARKNVLNRINNGKQVNERIQEIKKALSKSDPVLFAVYDCADNIKDYKAAGGALEGLNNKEILNKTVNRAFELGLEPSLEMAFRKASDIYAKASKGTKMWLSKETEILQKAFNILFGMRRWLVFFDPKNTSLTADRLGKYMKFLSIEAADAKIQRLPLHAFNKFYRPNGEVTVATLLDRFRALIINKADSIHSALDASLKEALASLKDAIAEPDNQNAGKTLDQEMWPRDRAQPEKKASPEYMVKELSEFFETPKNLEIKNASIDEITARLKARNVKQGFSLNQPPDGFILKLALQDCMIDGKLEDGKLIISSHDFDPDQLNTYGINAHFKNPKIKEYANEWFTYSIKTFGVEGALKFYEMVGFTMVTMYPPPSERTFLVIIGDPGSGKGTHLAGLEELLTFDGVRLFSKATPHKLADPWQHFAMQDLSGKLAVIAGDLKHMRIRDFADVNDLFGGEPAKIERKFRDPTTENVTLKAFWASTPPLFKIDQPGGAWRRMNMIMTNPVSSKDRDNNIKPRLVKMVDGFFLNGLVGLSYLATNGWKFTGELSDEEIENIWNFQSDSVAVFAEKLYPEPAEIEDGIENIEKRRLVDDVYAEYEKWAKVKQIDPVKPKTFSAWLKNHDFEIVRRRLDEHVRKWVTYLTDDRKNDDENKPEKETGQNFLPWETYFSKAPVIISACPDSLLQVMRMREENNNKNSTNIYREMQQGIWTDENTSQKTNNTKPPSDETSVQFLFQDEKCQKTDSSDGNPEATPAREKHETENDPHDDSSTSQTNSSESNSESSSEPAKSDLSSKTTEDKDAGNSSSKEPEKSNSSDAKTSKYYSYEVLKHYYNANGLANNPGEHFTLPEYLKELIDNGYVKCLNCEQKKETNTSDIGDTQPAQDLRSC